MINKERIIEDGEVSTVLLDTPPVTKQEEKHADKLFKSITKEVR